MASDMEDSNANWNLSFDDDFDTSSDSMEPHTPTTESKRASSSFSNEGFKSTMCHVKVDDTQLRQEASSSRVHSTPTASQSKSSPYGSLPDRPHSSQHPAQSPTRARSTMVPKHRQAKSSSQKWRGAAINTSSSSSSSQPIISPYNSPLMSSFATAQDHQERISAGTLSGLVIRFLRSKHVSSLALRILSFIFVLLLTTIMVNRGNKHPLRLSVPTPPSIILGTLDDDANLLAARALLQLNEAAKGYVSEQAFEVDDNDVGTERWKQEERRIAHARMAKARLSKSEALSDYEAGLLEDRIVPEPEDTVNLQEAKVLPNLEEIVAPHKEDSAPEQPKQRFFTKLRTAEAMEDDAQLEGEEALFELVLPVEGGEQSSVSQVANPVVSEEPDAEMDLPIVADSDLSSTEETEEAGQMDETSAGEQAPVMWRKGGVAADLDLADPSSDILEDTKPSSDSERVALLEQLQVARQLAQLEFGDLQAERLNVAQLPAASSSEESDYEFLQVELDEKEVV